jgi:mercuric ion binding protein
MKKYLVLFCIFCAFNSQAQDKKGSFETDTILTSAECENCKERIEDMLNYTKGVKFAELEVKTKKLVVKFNTDKITLSEIKQKLSELGYDADEVKANESAQKKLPLCCQPGGMKK